MTLSRQLVTLHFIHKFYLKCILMQHADKLYFSLKKYLTFQFLVFTYNTYIIVTVLTNVQESAKLFRLHHDVCSFSSNDAFICPIVHMYLTSIAHLLLSVMHICYCIYPLLCRLYWFSI